MVARAYIISIVPFYGCFVSLDNLYTIVVLYYQLNKVHYSVARVANEAFVGGLGRRSPMARLPQSGGRHAQFYETLLPSLL